MRLTIVRIEQIKPILYLSHNEKLKLKPQKSAMFSWPALSYFCAEFACSLSACMAFLQGPRFPPLVRTHALRSMIEHLQPADFIACPTNNM